jgi:hypothetical protein
MTGRQVRLLKESSPSLAPRVHDFGPAKNLHRVGVERLAAGARGSLGRAWGIIGSAFHGW